MCRLTDVTKDYPKGRGVVHALRGVNVVIGAGEWLAIQGRSWPSPMTGGGCSSRPSAPISGTPTCSTGRTGSPGCATSATPGPRPRSSGRSSTRLSSARWPSEPARWDEGCHSTEQLHTELRDRGYSGSLRTLRRLTAQLRRDAAIPAPPPAPPAKKAARWILTRPGDLTDDDRADLAQITARCEELKTTRDLVREFADMLFRRRGERLEAWASQAEASPVSELRGFS